MRRTLLIVMTTILMAASAQAQKVFQFLPGKWNTNEWSAVRLPNQERPVALIQKPTSIGTTMNTFSAADYGAERDNALLLYDTKTTEGEVELTFGLGKGFSVSSSPGFCISPKVKDGTFESGIAVFVADYAIVVWYEYADGNTMKYKHLGQLARWSDPSKKHTLRCRFSKKQQSVGIQLDDSDPLVFQFIGNSHLSNIQHEINSSVGLWGCHGVSDFYEMKVGEGTMPFLVREPTARKPEVK